MLECSPWSDDLSVNDVNGEQNKLVSNGTHSNLILGLVCTILSNISEDFETKIKKLCLFC